MTATIPTNHAVSPRCSHDSNSGGSEMIPEPTAEDLARDAEVFYALHEVLVKHGVATYANSNADAMQWIRRTAAAERERDELRKRHRENEQQLCDIATTIGGDARHVKGDGPHTIAALVKQRFDELKKQLPEEMPGCTILFKRCEKGHGWLTATNWVQYGCPTCECYDLKRQIESDWMERTANTVSREQYEFVLGKIASIERERDELRAEVDILKQREALLEK